MSRCFPYPPPGFNGKRAIDLALIQSIKLQKDLENATTERRKEKKRRETKKHKETANLTSAEIAYAHKGEKSCTKLKGGDTNKRKQEDAEHLEKSDMTEEQGQPCSLQNPSYSSDSTQNSNKRRKQATNVNVDNSRGHGNIIRIRLPLQKHKESAFSACEEQLPSSSGNKGQHKESDVSVSKEQMCSTNASKDLHGHHGYDIGRRTNQDHICSSFGANNDNICSLLGTNNVVQGLLFSPNTEELSCSTSGWTGGLALDDNQITPGFSSYCTSKTTSEMQKIDLYTKFLIQNLVPPALPSDLSSIDDDEWLFRRKKIKASDCVSCCGSSASYTHAQFLVEADIYALPYTFPF